MKTSIFTETVQYKRHRTKGVSFSSIMAIPAIDVIVEERVKKDDSGNVVKNTKGNPVMEMVSRKIRYVPGESSIYADEQSESVDEKRLTPILLEGHAMFVSKSELLKVDYLNKCNFNRNNKFRKKEASIMFYTYDRDSEFKKVNEDKFSRIEAEGLVMKMHISELKALLMLASENYTSVARIADMGRSEIIHDCLLIARDQPGLIVKGLKSKSERNKYLLLQSISQGLLKYNEKTEELHWSGGSKLVTAPLGQNAIDYFVSRTLEDDASIDEIMDQIKRKVTYDVESDSKEIAEKSMEALLLEKAVKVGLVEVKGVWHRYVNNEAKIDIKTQGAADFIKKLEEDVDLFHTLNKDTRALKLDKVTVR